MFSWFRVLSPLPPQARRTLGVASFLLPVALWCLVSYVPAIWHPQVQITDAGSVTWLDVGARLPKDAFVAEVNDARQERRQPPSGVPANPVYLPSPGEVAQAFYRAFVTPPETRDGPWLHQ